MIGKKNFSVPLNNQFCNTPLPLGGVFELVKSAQDGIEIAKITKLNKLQTLSAHTYRNQLISRSEKLEWHFKVISALAIKFLYINSDVQLLVLQQPIWQMKFYIKSIWRSHYMLKNKLINHTQLVSQVPGNIASDMDGEKVILSIENGKYYNLGEVGGEIWSRISVPIRLDALITNLMEEFNVGRDVCEADVQYFLEKLLDEGLVKVD